MSTNTKHAPSPGIPGWLAAVGFSLGPLAGGSARAQSMSLSDPSDLSASFTTSSSIALATTVATAVTVVAGGITMVVMVSGDKARPELELPTEGEKTERLLEAGLLQVRGDLGASLTVLVESPAALDQLSDEFERGTGPAIDALVRATGLAAPVLKERWDATVAEHGPAESQEAASQLVVDWLLRLAPDLQPTDEQKVRLLWQLARERQGNVDPNVPQVHRWIADWLEVPQETVWTASGVAFSEIEGMSEERQREALAESPDTFLRELCAAIELRSEDMIDARIAALVQDLMEVLPPEASVPVEQPATVEQPTPPADEDDLSEEAGGLPD